MRWQNYQLINSHLPHCSNFQCKSHPCAFNLIWHRSFSMVLSHSRTSTFYWLVVFISFSILVDIGSLRINQWKETIVQSFPCIPITYKETDSNLKVFTIIQQRLEFMAASSWDFNEDTFLESLPSPVLFQSPLFSALAHFYHSTFVTLSIQRS